MILFMDSLLNLSLLYLPVVRKLILEKRTQESQGFDVFHGGTFFFVHSPEKVEHFRHLGYGITPWHAPTMLRGTPKPSSKPPAGPPWG